VNQNTDSELEELIANIQKNNQIRFFIFSTFILLSLLLIWFGIKIPILVVGVEFFLFFSNLFCEFLRKKVWVKKTVSQVSLSYLIFQIIEIISLLVAISHFDAVLFGGIVFLMIYQLFAYLGFTRIIYPRIIASFCGISFLITALLEHFGITPYLDFYNSGVNLNQNRPLFIATITYMMGAFLYSTLYGDFFTKKMRKLIDDLRLKTQELTKREEELKEAKAVLEIKVAARTRKLSELAQSLEEQVKERTKELQEKIQELEKFQKIAVGRELKMIELKKEIQRLKNILGSYKKEKNDQQRRN